MAPTERAEDASESDTQPDLGRGADPRAENDEHANSRGERPVES